MRRGAWRTVLAGIVVLVLLTGFTAGGISMLLIGELPGLPFAVGGAAAQLAAIVISVTALRVRATLVQDTVSRHALQAAHRAYSMLRLTLLMVIVVLALYAIVRLVTGDPWTVLTAAIIGVVLWLLLRGSKRLRDGASAMLHHP